MWVIPVETCSSSETSHLTIPYDTRFESHKKREFTFDIPSSDLS